MAERLGSRPQAVANPLDAPADRAQRPVGDQEHHAERDQHHEQPYAEHAEQQQVVIDRPPKQRRNRQHGHGEHDGEGEQVGGGQPGDRGGAANAGGHQHPVLQRSPDSAAPRRDLGERVAGELRCDDRLPSVDVDRETLQGPQAREGGRLGQDHHHQPTRGELFDVLPRAEDFEHAGRDEVEGDGRDGQPQGGPRDAPPGRRLGPDRAFDVRAVLDRVLEPVAQPLPLRH